MHRAYLEKIIQIIFNKFKIPVVESFLKKLSHCLALYSI